ncbi:heme acquisition protein HasA [Billgrantia endophytica]|uniref:Hemophore HasA n=1 Tax=Billgrantia endophytica TaxID=2033802 RepID=A0A2N7TXD7_9GAMM|nr:heme acquisition protein HasA [Halomonas endophytica]PMR72840.1 hemophore HasA [Halomonas endophytica]
MSFFVEYGGDLTASSTLADFFADFSDFFAQDGHEFNSWFNSEDTFPGPLSGTQYAIVSELDDIEDFSFIAGAAEGSELTYTLFGGVPFHTLYGSLDSLEFGTGLEQWDETGDGNFALGETYLDISGLDLFGELSEGQANVVHEVVWGLMGGETDALADVINDILADYNLTVDSTFAELELAGLAGPASVTGVTEVSDFDLALAA